jgi:hypothetical protein
MLSPEQVNWHLESMKIKRRCHKRQARQVRAATAQFTDIWDVKAFSDDARTSMISARLTLANSPLIRLFKPNFN